MPCSTSSQTTGGSNGEIDTQREWQGEKEEERGVEGEEGERGIGAAANHHTIERGMGVFRGLRVLDLVSPFQESVGEAMVRARKLGSESESESTNTDEVDVPEDW